MEIYQKPLVAVDGSPASLHALREALKLAGKDQELLVLAVAPPYAGDLRTVGVSELSRLLREPCETALQQAAALAGAAGVSVRPLCVLGDPAQTIAEVAEEEHCDLIVMGVRGRTFAGGLLVGSTTARVIGLAPQDVLAIPETAELHWRRLLVATDGSECGRQAAAKAIALARHTGGTLNVLSVLEISSHIYAVAPEFTAERIQTSRRQVEEIQTLAAAQGVSAAGWVRESEAAYEVIVEVAKESQADLIVMGSHGVTGLKRLLLGSTTERVMAQAPCPVLVVKLS